jgi:ketosteroid isomerase-like protein
MSNGNITLVQSLYAAFGRGDIATLVAAMAPDVRREVVGRPKDYPLLGVFKGQEGVREFFRLIGELQEAVAFAPRDFHASGDMVFVLGSEGWKLRKTGKPVATEWAHIFTIKDGKVTAFREFTDTAQFAEASRG